MRNSASKPRAVTAKAHGRVRKTGPLGGGVHSGSGDTADGKVVAFRDNGGRVLKHPKIVLIFWGSDWADLSIKPNSEDVTRALKDIVDGPWGTQLFQYRGIGRMSIEKTLAVTNSTPNTTFSDPQIVNFLDLQMATLSIPLPSNDVDRIYVVLMPQGHSSQDHPADVGQHQMFSVGGQDVFWTWVTNDGTLSTGNSIPDVFCHEVAETCSDPELGSGISVDTPGLTNEEIGDVCNNTSATVNGVAIQAYWSQVDGRCVAPVFQPFQKAQANPSLIQGRFGRPGNFELVVASASGGLDHYWRNNDVTAYNPWSGRAHFGDSVGHVDGVSLIQSNYASPGNFEVVVRVGSDLHHFWRDSSSSHGWSGATHIASGVRGTPCLIQSKYGNKGNFEVVVGAAGGGLLHFWRNNDAARDPWSAPTHFAAAIGHVDSASLIESNYGAIGNLEVVARVGTTLHSFWRGDNLGWNGPTPIPGAVSGTVALVQGRYGKKGNFEVIAPAASGGGFIHLWRNNDATGNPWSPGSRHAAGLGTIDAVTMIESNYGAIGNLEVVARVGTVLHALWRDSSAENTWHGPTLMRSTVY
jgi:hypothetical protein